ncbi:MAG: trigger factor [Phycisphaerae bacterium]|jgi:trigger factor
MAEDVKLIVTAEDAGPCRKKITIEIPEEAVKETLLSQYTDLRKDVVLPGFRRGRAPRRLLEKRFGTEVGEQTKLKLLADCTEKALKDNNINYLGEPEINPESLELPETGSFTYYFEVNVRPEITLPQLEDVEIEKPIYEVTEEQIEKHIEDMRKRWGTDESREEGATAELGDILKADVTITPEEEEAVVVKDTDVSINENYGFAGKVPVDGLHKLLMDAKVGDIKETETQVSETFFNKDFQGKKCAVKIEVKDITYRKPAELNDEFCEKIGIKSVDYLKSILTKYAAEDADKRSKDGLVENVRKYLLDKCDFDLPTNLVSEQANSIMNREYSRVLMQGLQKDELKAELEKLQTSSQDQAKDMLKSFFIIDAVADELKIEITPDELNGYIARIAAESGRRPEKVREEMAKDGSLTELMMQIREQKCYDAIIEKAKVTEVPVKE